MITRTPYCTKVRYGITGAPILTEDELDGSHAPGVGVRPTLIELVYSEARDGKAASVSASVTGDWMRFGKRDGGQVTTHFSNGPDGWPWWLADEAHEHDPERLVQQMCDALNGHEPPVPNETPMGTVTRFAVRLMEAERELAELQDELAETKALHDPRLRGILVKTAPDKDQYVLWSTVADGPKGVWSRETATEYGWPRTYLDRADATGTSARNGEGGWDDSGFVADQRGWLRRDRLGDYAIEYLLGDRIAAYAMLEPFEDETEVRR